MKQNPFDTGQPESSQLRVVEFLGEEFQHHVVMKIGVFADGVADAAGKVPERVGRAFGFAASVGFGLGNGGVGLPLEVAISIKGKDHKGAAAMKFLRQAETEYPALAPVLAVQKAYLAKRGLRGVYKGGIGSYSLALMALHSMQQAAARSAGAEGGLGAGDDDMKDATAAPIAAIAASGPMEAPSPSAIVFAKMIEGAASQWAWRLLISPNKYVRRRG